MIYYCLGCFLALILLVDDYCEEYPDVCEHDEALTIICFGTFCSWLTVILFIYKEFN